MATQGWTENSKIEVNELAKSFQDAGVAAIIFTDINRDGAMQGPNVRATADLAHAVSIPIIASGGVSKIQDLVELKNCGAPLNGVVSGRALYEDNINLRQALRVLNA